MKNKTITLFAGLLTVMLFSFGTMRTAEKISSLKSKDTSDVATVTYAGSSTLKVNLYKVNGKARSEYIEKSLFFSYSKVGSLGFSVQVPVGESTFEIFDIRQKEFVKLILNLEKKSYLCDFKEGYKVYELDDANNKKEIPVQVEKVALYDENIYDQTATLHVDKQENMPMIFRINDFAPSSPELGIGILNAFNKVNANFDIKITEGKNKVEVGINGKSSGPSGQKYFIVHTLEFDAVKGKTYTIKVEQKKIEKNIVVLSPHIEER